MQAKNCWKRGWPEKQKFSTLGNLWDGNGRKFLTRRILSIYLDFLLDIVWMHHSRENIPFMDSRWEDVWDFSVICRRKLCLEPPVVVTQLEKLVLLWIVFAVICDKHTWKRSLLNRPRSGYGFLGGNSAKIRCFARRWKDGAHHRVCLSSLRQGFLFHFSDAFRAPSDMSQVSIVLTKDFDRISPPHVPDHPSTLWVKPLYRQDARWNIARVDQRSLKSVEMVGPEGQIDCSSMLWYSQILLG